MAPATLAGATLRTPRTGRGGWDRDSIINAIQEWVATYGEPPRAADWNPSSAKWSGQTWRVERYRAGRGDGTAWPALNSAKRPFGGSLTAAVKAAGFEPAKPGPKRRTDVDLAQADRAQISPEGRAMLDAALAAAKDAHKRATALEGQLDRARDRAARAADERDAAQRLTRSLRAQRRTEAVRERVVDERVTARALKRATAAEARALVAVATAEGLALAARSDATEARTTAKRLASRLERSEATVSTLRGERRELRTERDRAVDRVTALERLLEAARADAAQAVEAVPDEVEVVVVEAPEAAELRAAQTASERDRRVAEAAELRAAAAERELRETVAALRGEARRLTPAELAGLRDQGPSGPAVLAEAITALAAARRNGSPTALGDALGRVARAAVTWQDRL